MMCIAVKLSSASKSLLTTIANRNYHAKRSGLIVLKKFENLQRTSRQTNKQTNKQTNRQRIQIQRPLLSPVDRRGERANRH